MTDGRRHSVDIPISRTLIALRRVRSLRDPATNSMSKFSALPENVNWETNSTNGISVRFENSCKERGFDHNGLLGSKSLGFNGIGEEKDDLEEMHCGLDNSKLIRSQNFGLVESTGTPTRVKQVERLDNFQSNGKEVHGNDSRGGRYCSSNYRDKELDVNCILPSSDPMEDVDSCNGPIVESLSMEGNEQSASTWKPRYRNEVKLYGAGSDVASRVNSQCPSVSDTVSNNCTSLFAHQEVDYIDHNHRGCGISYCWSRTPRSRESNPSSDVEDYPLLSRDVGQTIYGHRHRKCSGSQVTSYSETPRSLSQKFRPKCFDELVGQDVVVRSLLSAVSRGMVTSFYLFHGPRGTGKTSASRIFSAALNCLSIEEHKPCGLCRECILFFSGRTRDVKEVDSVRINRTDRIGSLMKNAFVPPSSSRFKIFIFDECQLLHGETWTTILSSLGNISQHVVFVMITPDLDKLPRSAVSRSQKYHFPNIKDADIASRLRKICVEEALDFDQIALDLIAAKSNGSLRDAEMMLDQLSLLGNRITMSLAYELIGTVSDDELLNLLDLALSSDHSNTVIMARELMRSKIDPMQLISQLANLIMDILAGKCQEGSSEARRRFFERHASEADMQKLSHALKILTETEKQLRMSKHQTTWLTVALLQLSSVESSSLDVNDSKLSLRSSHDKDDESRGTISPGESLKHPVTCSCDDNKSHQFGTDEECKGALESIWRRATEGQSNSLKKFLRKQGKLFSLQFNQGLAVAELQFHHPDSVSKAEKSWKSIASSLQLILGCNVEIRLLCAPAVNGTKVRKPSFSLFNCSRRIQQKSQSTERGSDSDYSDYISEKPIMKERHSLTCSSDCGSQMSHNCYHKTEVIKTLRNSEGNVLSTGTALSIRSMQDDILKTPGYGISSLKEEGDNCRYKILSIQEPEHQPSCFPRTLRLQKKPRAADMSRMVSSSNQEESKLGLSIPGKASFKTCVAANDPYFLPGNTNSYTNSFRDEDGRLRENSDVLCWRTPTFPLRKVTTQNTMKRLGRWRINGGQTYRNAFFLVLLRSSTARMLQMANHFVWLHWHLNFTPFV
ncbi:hypothetical protein LWI28_015133 [Acer negundo]|uniref:AAA+ ATPase domain-containing protein n=1 Tax=Acer negundo TaxID=4023 RepID=A0AAD5NQ61_ACENE|nr:hypothetical protein LWI28_015133 [Acer negundo]